MRLVVVVTHLHNKLQRPPKISPIQTEMAVILIWAITDKALHNRNQILTINASMCSLGAAICPMDKPALHSNLRAVQPCAAQPATKESCASMTMSNGPHRSTICSSATSTPQWTGYEKESCQHQASPAMPANASTFRLMSSSEWTSSNTWDGTVVVTDQKNEMEDWTIEPNMGMETTLLWNDIKTNSTWLKIELLNFKLI